jgi:DNA ligase (NAD+)
MSTDKIQLEMIKDIGPIVGENIYKFFKLKKNKDNISKLIKNGIHIIYSEASIVQEYNGMTFVVTGVFDNYKRKDIEDRIRLKGGNISVSVSKKTHALILGTNPGSKYQRALDLNIKIIEESGLPKLL